MMSRLDVQLQKLAKQAGLVDDGGEVSTELTSRWKRELAVALSKQVKRGVMLRSTTCTFASILPVFTAEVIDRLAERLSIHDATYLAMYLTLTDCRFTSSVEVYNELKQYDFSEFMDDDILLLASNNLEVRSWVAKSRKCRVGLRNDILESFGLSEYGLDPERGTDLGDILETIKRIIWSREVVIPK